MTTYHMVLLLIPYRKETLSGGRVDLFPVGHYWRETAALPAVYVGFSYESSYEFE